MDSNNQLFTVATRLMQNSTRKSLANLHGGPPSQRLRWVLSCICSSTIDRQPSHIDCRQKNVQICGQHANRQTLRSHATNVSFTCGFASSYHRLLHLKLRMCSPITYYMCGRLLVACVVSLRRQRHLLRLQSTDEIYTVFYLHNLECTERTANFTSNGAQHKMVDDLHGRRVNFIWFLMMLVCWMKSRIRFQDQSRQVFSHCLARSTCSMMTSIGWIFEGWHDAAAFERSTKVCWTNVVWACYFRCQVFTQRHAYRSFQLYHRADVAARRLQSIVAVEQKAGASNLERHGRCPHGIEHCAAEKNSERLMTYDRRHRLA